MFKSFSRNSFSAKLKTNQNRRLSEAPSFLQLKIGVNIYIQDLLINGQVGENTHINTVNNSVQIVNSKFSYQQTELKWKASYCFSRQH